MPEPVLVTSGFTPTTWATIGTAVIALFGFLGLLVRQWIPWLKVKIGAEQQMRDELRADNAKLSTRVSTLETTLEKERAIARSAEALAEHRINGLEMLLLTTFETLRVASPERIPEIIERMMAGWDKHKERVAMEKGRVMAMREGVSDD